MGNPHRRIGMDSTYRLPIIKYKSSKANIEKLMHDFFKTTSYPRIIEKYNQNPDSFKERLKKASNS
jgi:hypothetical protein